jgi:hypothetical protein
MQSARAEQRKIKPVELIVNPENKAIEHILGPLEKIEKAGTT